MRGRSIGGALVGAAGGDHEAVDALAQQLVEMLALARRIVGGVAHEDARCGCRRGAPPGLDDRHGEAAEAVVGDEPDGEALAAVQALREVVRAEAELAGDARCTWSRVSCRRRPPLLSALDAVPMLTAASRATSRMVGRGRVWRPRRRGPDARRIGSRHRLISPRR